MDGSICNSSCALEQKELPSCSASSFCTADCRYADEAVLSLTRTGQDPQEVRQEDRRADPAALHPERDAGALLHHRPPVQAREGVRGDAGAAPAEEPAARATERRREGGQRRRWRRQACGCHRLVVGQRRWRGPGAGGDRGHGEHVHEEHRGRAQVAQGDPERELHGERLLPAAAARRQWACGGAGDGLLPFAWIESTEQPLSSGGRTD